ncbi:DEAD/DEAH box helicase [Tessaracoccus oleiagri]|uniref:Superfamily II DNA and RNA helicase n=1 Tax=Tessaracoccus oleiagri TaxID=686624 RepID=A0A1G9L4P8_9ACTN|nr:DEAD/DEAH box helicase [Tessaracoccus oleiagri]SDL56969.1 Superfamily II DNA and RNA helicase [Tessaracoccus oleiagri]
MSSDFARLGVPTSFVAALSERGITSPTPIQAATLPDSLSGRDVLGRGRTGSGKTFAFLLPLVARLVESNTRKHAKRPRSLVLAPTRELATQIAASLAPLEKVAGLTSTVVFGGVGQNPQVKALQRGVDVLIACPGRLLDLMGQGFADLSAIEITVIDEADHMADMGFLPGVRKIMQATPAKGQRMLFSATLDAGVSTLVKQFLHDPVTHEADSEHSPVGTMEHHVLRVSNEHRTQVLADLAAAPGNTIIFTRTKHGAKKLAKQLLGMGIPAVDLHGNLSQNARTRNMDAFHSGRVTTLVATDIAARGIHVDDVSLVVHADPPAEHKAYLHRSGRTARAGASGTVVTLELPAQRNEVRTLLRQAKISPKFTDAAPGHGILSDLAPGERTFLPAEKAAELAGANRQSDQPQTRHGGGGGRGRSTGGGAGRARQGGGRGQQPQANGGSRRGGRGSRGSSSPVAAGSGSSRSAADFSRGFRSR